MTLKEKLELYEQALINIKVWYGKCWDGDRVCNDPQQVSRTVLKKVNPSLYQKLENTSYENVTVFKNGKIKIKGVKL